MNSLTKIFIAERDCERLVNTMLWLEQYPDFEVYGSALTDGSLREQIDELQPEIVMLSGPSTAAEAAMAVKVIRSTKAAPAVVLVSKSDNMEPVAAECEGHVGPKTELKDIHDVINKAVNRRRIAAIAATAVSMAKAG
jgi:hypothetical protein